MHTYQAPGGKFAFLFNGEFRDGNGVEIHGPYIGQRGKPVAPPAEVPQEWAEIAHVPFSEIEAFVLSMRRNEKAYKAECKADGRHKKQIHDGRCVSCGVPVKAKATTPKDECKILDAFLRDGIEHKAKDTTPKDECKAKGRHKQWIRDGRCDCCGTPVKVKTAFVPEELAGQGV